MTLSSSVASHNDHRTRHTQEREPLHCEQHMYGPKSTVTIHSQHTEHLRPAHLHVFQQKRGKYFAVSTGDSGSMSAPDGDRSSDDVVDDGDSGVNEGSVNCCDWAVNSSEQILHKKEDVNCRENRSGHVNVQEGRNKNSEGVLQFSPVDDQVTDIIYDFGDGHRNSKEDPAVSSEFDSAMDSRAIMSTSPFSMLYPSSSAVMDTMVASNCSVNDSGVASSSPIINSKLDLTFPMTEEQLESISFADENPDTCSSLDVKPETICLNSCVERARDKDNDKKDSKEDEIILGGECSIIEPSLTLNCPTVKTDETYDNTSDNLVSTQSKADDAVDELSVGQSVETQVLHVA